MEKLHNYMLDVLSFLISPPPPFFSHMRMPQYTSCWNSLQAGLAWAQ